MSPEPLSFSAWSWIIGFLLVAFAFSVYHARRSSQSIENYFVAGRNTPWWILGTSIVATTFAADTPLVVTALVIDGGISANWYWWSVVPSGMLGVFFFAGLWHRSGCLTQAEFAVIRYGPQRARVLRLFYVFYFGVLRNAVTLGFVNLAMVKIITLCTPLEQWNALSICFVLTVVYTTLGGINGVMWTDFLQFFLAVGAAILTARFAVQGSFGSLSELVAAAGENAVEGTSSLSETLSYFPDSGSSWGSFLIFVTIYWIACTPTDCNGYAVQRLLSARSERHAVWGYLWFNLAHYVLRSWPWIIVALCAVGVYRASGATDDPDQMYVVTILRTAPGWLIGPALAALLAAYMSTVDTHLNWGASFLINDFYRPYVTPKQSDRHYVWASITATCLVATLGAAVTLMMQEIVEGWGLMYGLMSGMGIVGILRWLWWRVTAWTEIGCMLGAGASTVALYFWAAQLEFPFTLLIIVPVALLGAAIGTFGVSPEPLDTLRRFRDRVRPPGPGWSVPSHPQPFATEQEVYRAVKGTHLNRGDLPRQAQRTQPRKKNGLGRSTLCWALGTAAVYCAMFGVGDLLLKSTIRGLVLCAAAGVSALVLGRVYRSSVAEVGP